MPEKSFDPKYFSMAITTAKKRAKKLYSESRNHYVRMYSGKDGPIPSQPLERNYLNINEVYGDVEVGMSTTGYKNPRAHIKSKNKKWFFVVRPGDPKREMIPFGDGELKQYFIQMQQSGQNSLTIRKSGKELILKMLDGAKSARTIESIVNYLMNEKNLEERVDLAKADAQMGGMGAVWVDYLGDFALPCQESQYVKRNDIYYEYLDLTKDIIFDHLIKRVDQIDRSKWIARRYVKTINDLKDMKDLKHEDGSPFFIKSNLEEYISLGQTDEKMATVKNFTGDDEDIGSYRDGTDFYSKGLDMDTDDEKGMVIWQCWIRPTYKEMMDEKNDFRYGKIVYMGDNGFKKPLTKEKPWPHYMDDFPLTLLWYNLSFDSPYPVPDIKIYEDMLLEQNILRHHVRKYSDIISRLKIFVKNFDKNTMATLNSSEDVYIPVPGEANLKEDIFQFNTATPNAEYFAIYNVLNDEKQRISLTSNAQKGESPAASTTATAIAALDRAQLSRHGHRTHKIAKFYKKILRKTIQLAQQYYSEERIVPIIGNLESEWSDVFDRDSIQGEYWVDVDVMSMNPLDRDQVIQRSIDVLDLALGVFKDQNVYRKILSEGKEINLSELFGEILHRMDITNDKVFPNVNEKVKEVSDIALMMNLGMAEILALKGDPRMLQIFSGKNNNGNGSAGKPGPRTTGQRPAAERGTNPPPGSQTRPGNPPGEIMPPGGGNKLR